MSARDEQGNPLVFYLHAGLRRAPELLELLMTHGADPNARNRKERTAVDAALDAGASELADLLQRCGGKSSKELDLEGGSPPPP